MRHLGSLVLSFVLAPAIWALAGVGLVEHGQARGRVGTEARLVLALAALAVAGVLFTLLIMPRLSPVGPALAGLAFLGMIGWMTLDPGSLERTLPGTFLGTDGALASPALGYAVLLAIPLLATVFSRRRWRRSDRMRTQHPAAPEPYCDSRRFDGLGLFEAPGRFDEPPATRFSSASAPADAEATARIVPPPAQQTRDPAEEPTERVEGETRLLRGSPPPADAYPPPGHAMPTAAPVDTDGTRRF